jgi:hypothetical protein
MPRVAPVISIEKLTKFAFAVLFGWIIAILALETALRRRSAKRRARAAEIEAAYRERPKTRPTTEYRVARADPAPAYRPRIGASW